MNSSHQKIGLIPATSLVIGNMIGAGVFVLPAALSKYGSIGLIGWVISAFGAIILAIIIIVVAVPEGLPMMIAVGY